MGTILFLWLTVILYSFYFAGHMFDLLANVPNWKSGEINDVSSYRDFYSKSTPKNYFFPIVVGTPVISLITLIFVWNYKNPVTLLIAFSFLISIIVFVFTLRFFVPINEYILKSSEYDAETLKYKVSRWVKMDYVRILMVGVGLITSILGLNGYLK